MFDYTQIEWIIFNFFPPSPLIHHQHHYHCWDQKRYDWCGIFRFEKNWLSPNSFLFSFQTESVRSGSILIIKHRTKINSKNNFKYQKKNIESKETFVGVVGLGFSFSQKQFTFFLLSITSLAIISGLLLQTFPILNMLLSSACFFFSFRSEIITIAFA